MLSPDQLQEYQPNELGVVPVFMYHNIVQEYGPGEEGDVLFRTEAEFRDDLQFLYDNNFYIITYREYIENRITAPAGKHPAVLVFDDSRPNQFYYNVADDGSLDMDPHSAIGIMEDFFSTHPDFGHTAMFGVIEIWCFDFEAPDQTQYCQQKLQWLVDNGYEVANHTLDHQDLSNVTTEVFMDKVGGTTLWLQEQTGQESASGAVVLPYGLFPDTDINPEALEQWHMVRDGFDYEGQHVQLISLLAAGAEPAPSPNSTQLRSHVVARIGAKDEPSEGEGNLFLDYWFSQFLERPDLLYISDGNPDTITVPSVLPPNRMACSTPRKSPPKAKSSSSTDRRSRVRSRGTSRWPTTPSSENESSRAVPCLTPSSSHPIPLQLPLIHRRAKPRPIRHDQLPILDPQRPLQQIIRQQETAHRARSKKPPA